MKKKGLVKYAQIDLLLELDRICKKRGLKYILGGGTLIGAIRHNGFIPWDDDIDVGMPRNDYDKLIEICDEELDPEYEKTDWFVDEASPIPFLKLKIKGTHYKEGLTKNTNINDAVYIDIFPFDNAPDSKIKRKIQGTQIYLLKKILLLRCGFTIDDNKVFWKKALYQILKTFSKVKSVRNWKITTENVLRRYNQEPTECIVSMCGAYAYRKEIDGADLFEWIDLHEFEGFQLPIPHDYDVFLRRRYGDYMQLPPEKERYGRHEISVIDLGNYQIRSLKERQGV